MDKPLLIEYYTDILCVWAWIAQRRVDELEAEYGDRVCFRRRYIDLFGDTKNRMQEHWADRGSYDGFREHVCQAVTPYDSAPVSKGVWSACRPTTSGNAHLVIKAVELSCGEDAATRLALDIRKAFFVDALDISRLDLLMELVKTQQTDHQAVWEAINCGTATASVMNDYQRAKNQGIKGSPSYVIDGGRQTLYGNVGFRVLHANINELLKNPEDEASWC